MPHTILGWTIYIIFASTLYLVAHTIYSCNILEKMYSTISDNLKTLLAKIGLFFFKGLVMAFLIVLYVFVVEFFVRQKGL